MLLSACAGNPKVQTCSPPPENLFVTTFGKEPTFSKKEILKKTGNSKVLNEDVLDYLIDWDRYTQELKQNMDLIKAHQAPCRKK